MTCDQCERLWKAYEAAVFDDVRLAAKLKIAQASSDEHSTRQLAGEVAAGQAKRAKAWLSVVDHERESGHGDAAAGSADGALAESDF